MFTIKIYYSSGQAGIFSAERVNVGADQRSVSLLGPGDRGDLFQLDGTESVFIENSAGKTVHVISPKPSSAARA